MGELFFLWAIVNNQAVNTKYYLITHLASVAEGDKGKNVIGGLITYIGQHLGLGASLDGMERVPGGTLIDLDVCTNMLMIKPINLKSRGGDTDC